MQKDRYEILGPLGFGATSRVDKARDKIIGRTVAIKTLVHSFGAAPQQKQFLREAQIVSKDAFGPLPTTTPANSPRNP